MISNTSVKDAWNERFPKLLKERGYTQTGFAELLNSIFSESGRTYAQSNVSRWSCIAENQKMPTIETICRIASVLNVDIGYLLGEYDIEKYDIGKIADLLNLNYETVASILNLTTTHDKIFDGQEYLFVPINIVSQKENKVLIDKLFTKKESLTLLGYLAEFLFSQSLVEPLKKAVKLAEEEHYALHPRISMEEYKTLSVDEHKSRVKAQHEAPTREKLLRARVDLKEEENQVIILRQKIIEQITRLLDVLPNDDHLTLSEINKCESLDIPEWLLNE